MLHNIKTLLSKPLIPFTLIIIIAIFTPLYQGVILLPFWIFLIYFWVAMGLQDYYLHHKFLLKQVYIFILPAFLILGILIGGLSFQIDGFLIGSYGLPTLFISIMLLGLFIWDKFLPSPKSFNSFHILVQILWVIITTIIYYFWWPANIAFTVFLLPTWLFLGIAWFWIFIINQKWWSLVGIAISFPIILFLFQIGTSRLNFWVTERQLDNFIVNASEGEIIDEVEISAYGGVKIADFVANSTADYEIMYLDTLIFGPDEYRVDFSNGVTYHVSIQGPFEDGHWYVGLNTWR